MYSKISSSAYYFTATVIPSSNGSSMKKHRGGASCRLKSRKGSVRGTFLTEDNG